jgi:hypothetical protein
MLKNLHFLLLSAFILVNGLVSELNQHLVVLSHGISGTSVDLNFISNRLQRLGINVLNSKSNEGFKSYSGIQLGAKRLADEVKLYLKSQPHQIKYISFVGNSLGGLYARYSLKYLHEYDKQTVSGLIPHNFITIATPHLGVYDYTYLDDMKLSIIPGALKTAVSNLLFQSIKDLFDYGDKSLLFNMSTKAEFLQPLKLFHKRRLYANLNRDFVVPLATAAFLYDNQVDMLRSKFHSQYGIVERFHSNSTSYDDRCDSHSYKAKMIDGLNECLWEKVIVNFNGIIPIAHNKICALYRKPLWLYHNILGFNEGEFVMNDLVSMFESS